ncbi:MAG: hypothetical protein KBC57_05690 [Neisseriaceae bacterium]|nr:hypothetical protein [Neisseriaceae bacterium]MBP6861832.1 hypothetical protein [Neisseriaceae bacterium]
MNIDNDLSQFLSCHKPSARISKLEPFKNEIFYLKENGYSEKDILKFLADFKQISVSQPSLNWFIRSRLLKSNTAP